MLSAKEKTLLNSLEACSADRNIEIVTVEVIGAKKSPVIRVYIDTLGEGGISFNELTDAQEWIGSLMDEIDPFPGAYTLEVSSPGIDRPLRTPEHFKRFIGDEASIRTVEPVEGSKNFKGTIEDADDNNVCISVEGKHVNLAYENIKRANLIGKIDF